MARRFAEWSRDGTVEVVTHGPTDCYEVYAVDQRPGYLLGARVGTVTKDVTQARYSEWIADDGRGYRTFHGTLRSAMTALANREVVRRETAARHALDAESLPQ